MGAMLAPIVIDTPPPSHHRAGMLRPLALAGLAAALLAPLPASAADLLPHEASYVVRLGTSPSAPTVGTARQLLGKDCGVWRLERDVRTEIGFSASLRLTSESELRGVERDGAVFDYQLRRVQNGAEQAIAGRVSAARNGTRADLILPSRPLSLTLPAGVVLPVSAFAYVIDALKRGDTSFSFMMYDAELTSDALQVDGGVAPADALRPARSDGARLPAGTTWPVEIRFSRTGANARPLFTVTLLLHEGGVLDRLTVNTGLLAASVDLVSFKPLPRPDCPTS